MPYNNFSMNYPQPYPNYPQFNNPYQQYSQQTPYLPQNQAQNQQVNNLPTQQRNAVSSPKFDIVQGELAANMYPTENGQEVILIDMDNPCIYKKKRGVDGKLEPMEIYDLVLREQTQKQPQIDLNEYVKQEDIARIVSDAVKIEVDKKLSEITLKPQTRKKTEE